MANLDLVAIKDVKDAVGRWTGDAACAFERMFVNPFDPRVTNQFIVASVVRFSVLAQQDIWNRVRSDIDGILHSTDRALDVMDDCGPNDWTFSFTVVASAACVLATVASGGIAGIAT
jgi:hypothetical protein